jgi:Ca2+-binding RTX toxin-like protein
MPAPNPVAGQTDLLLSPEDGTSRFGSEFEPDVAAGVNGGFVAIWDDFLPQNAGQAPPGYPPGYGFDADGGITVMLKRFGADGAALGPARPVTADLTGSSSGSGIVALGNGTVAIGWDVSITSGTPSTRIGALIVDAATGATIGTEVVVATGAGFAEGVAFQGIVALSGGRAGVVFVDGAGADRLRLAVIEADGTLGATTTLFTAAGNTSVPFIGPGQLSASLSGPNADVVAFVTQTFAGGVTTHDLRFLRADGSAAGFGPVALGASNDVPVVAALPGGGFAIARTAPGTPGTTDVAVRRFDAAGQLLGSETSFAFPYTNFSGSADLIGLPDGGLLVSISGVLPGFTDSNIYTQRIAPDGSLDGGVTRLDGAPDGAFQTRPQLALTSDNDLVTVWEDARSAGNPAINAARHDLGAFAGEAETLQGTGAADTLEGDSAGDRILGLGGDDLLRGLGGADTILGGGGADTVEGGDGADLLRGGLGNDLVLGGADADRLFGDAGADTLEGGAGADRLYGGAGNDGDVFRFAALADSSLAESDRIYDWSPGDRIDLSAIGGLSFIGAAPFTGGAGNGQVRVVQAGANTVVLVDSGDADRVAEMRIILSGLHTLTEGDFLL